MESEVFSVAIYYQKLTETELSTFIDMRIQQLREEGATEDIDLKPALFDYYHQHLADGTFVSWLALDGATIIGTSGMSFVEKPPYFGCPSGKIGLLSSMFTRSELSPRAALPKSCCPSWLQRRKHTAAERCRLQHLIWVCCCIPILAFRKTRILCS